MSMDEVVANLKILGITAVPMPMPNKDVVVLILTVEEAMWCEEMFAEMQGKR